MKLRELFRSRLKNAELDPEPSVNSKLMRRLARREFLMFNPARFNIYYLGGAILAAIAAAIILFSGYNNPVDIKEDSVRSESAVTQGIQVNDPEDAFVSNAVSAVETDVNTPKSVKVPVENTEESSVISKKGAVDNTHLRPVDNADIQPLQQNDLFRREEVDYDKLISRAKGVEQLFVSSVSEGCVPLKVKFIALTDDIDSCRWTFGDGGSSFEKAPEWIFDIEGEYKVVFEVYSSEKLIASSASFIKVHPRPVANFEISPVNALIPDDEIRFINYSTDAVKYIWDFGDGSNSDLYEPTHKYSKYGTYNIKLTALTEYGCADSLMVLNAFSGSRYYIVFPNAFIPNPNGPSGGIYSSASDEYAHVFHPGSSGVTEYQLRIFSKMGILIFESNDINIGWDGYFNGQLSNSGVYIWKVRGKYRNGEPFTKMGDVTLLNTN